MSTLIGHETIVQDFLELAESRALGHGYILCGPTMVGKRAFAERLANRIETGTFEAIAENAILQDMMLIDLASMKQRDDSTKDSIGIEAIREIKNFLWQKPSRSPRRTLIIDEAELLTTEAQNALLKITEEPPASSLLILIASDVESILPTIASRLPKIYFGTVSEKAIEAWLVGEHNLAKTKAAPLAKKSLGKPGLAYRLLTDKTFQKNLELAEKYLKSPVAGRKDLIKKIIDPDDFNLRIFLESVIINLAWEKPSKTRSALWHRTLELYGNAMNFGLNPRLQLEALFAAA
ncbi:MAG TPA: AAA family ATPase [Candidatus Paceibacterota bacterium]|nr:AAA family ATPase [Candidatus Paceibacterota bacterium]